MFPPKIGKVEGFVSLAESLPVFIHQKRMMKVGRLLETQGSIEM